MKIKTIVPVLLALLLLLALPAFAAAEEGMGPAAADVSPATPTDLDPPADFVPPADLVPPEDPAPSCPHEHTASTIYFYDSPSYFAVDEQIHRVAGTAYVETYCVDCGAILSKEDDVYAEEIRPHSFKNNTCALCGFRRLEEKPADAPKTAGPVKNQESTVFAIPAGTGVFSVTLTSAELKEYEDTGVATLLVRDQQPGNAAVALNVRDMQDQTEALGMDLRLDLLERDDGSFYAGLWLSRGGRDQQVSDKAGVDLRFYQAKDPALKVSLAPSDSDTLVEAEPVWSDKGYWTLPYQEEGTYFLRQQ